MFISNSINSGITDQSRIFKDLSALILFVFNTDCLVSNMFLVFPLPLEKAMIAKLSLLFYYLQLYQQDPQNFDGKKTTVLLYRCTGTNIKHNGILLVMGCVCEPKMTSTSTHG